MKYQVTKYYAWTIEVEADSESQAEEIADRDPIGGANLVADGDLHTEVELAE